MRKVRSAVALFAFAFLTVDFTGGIHKSLTAIAQSGDKLVYADFDIIKDNRPVSTRGGYVQIFSGSENSGNPPQFTGMT